MKLRWRNALILMFFCAVMGAAVAVAYGVAAPRIEKQAAEAANAARRALFPQAEDFAPVGLGSDSPLDDCYAVLVGGEVVGYTARATVSGCQDKIEIILGMDTGKKIVGISVGGSSFAETPGLGDKIRESDFTDQFIALSLPARLRENVDGVSGATISSEAVVSGVNLLGEALSVFIDGQTPAA